MPRLNKIEPQEATGEVKTLFNEVEKKLGKIPNIFRGMGNSAAGLKAYLHMADSLSNGQLSPADREAVYLAVSQKNECHYCVSAHTAMAKNAGLTEDQILSIRKHQPEDSKQRALVRFVTRVMDTKGFVEDGELETVKGAGYTDGEITEAIAYIGLASYSNLFNHVFGTELDFPEAPKLEEQPASS